MPVYVLLVNWIQQVWYRGLHATYIAATCSYIYEYNSDPGHSCPHTSLIAPRGRCYDLEAGARSGPITLPLANTDRSASCSGNA